MARARIKKITGVENRYYSDSGQTKTYVYWEDTAGATGRTEGDPNSIHIEQLIARARKEGAKLLETRW
jgi:hypothetical protein